MEAFWGILILLIVATILFLLLPTFVETPKRTVIVPVSAPPPPPDHTIKTEIAKNAEEDRKMLNSFYKEAPPSIPVDYERQPIGSCPFSKPMSRDLPLADVPMCLASSNGFDMHISK